MVPKPKILPYAETPILPFPASVWLGLIATMIINIILLYYFENIHRIVSGFKYGQQTRKKRGWNYAFLTIFRGSVFEGTQYEADNLSEFILFTLLLYYQLVMGNLYGGGLASVMTVTRYEEPIDNIQKLLNSHLLWGHPSADFTFSILHTENPILRQFIDGYSVFSMEKCTELGRQLKMALVVEQLQYGALGFSDFVDYELSKDTMIMKESLYNEMTVLLARKTWPFMYLLNDLVLASQQSGIGKFEELMASIRTTDYRIQSNLQAGVVEEDQIIPLQIAHIEGALFLLAFGYLCALVSFTFEHLFFRIAKVSKKA